MRVHKYVALRRATPTERDFMGSAKHQMMENEDNYNQARDFLCEVGCLEECENGHGTYYEGPKEIEAAYRAANAKITSGDLVLPRGNSRRDFTDRLKEVYEDNSFLGSCPVCDKNFGPD